MKGLNLSLGFTMTSFRGRKDKNKDVKSGPSPLPEKSLSSEYKKGDTTN